MITCTCSYKVKLNDYGMEELFSGSRKVLKLAERVSDFWGKVQSCTFFQKSMRLWKGMEMPKFHQEILEPLTHSWLAL